MASHPVRLEQPGKVVYSMHDYSWFHAQNESQSAYAEQMNKGGGHILGDQTAPLWIGEFGNDCGSLANFGMAPSSDVGNAATGVWWNNFLAWVTDNDIDWCWWAVNPSHGKATTPVTNKLQYDWGDREPYGLLTEDWGDVANPAVLKMLKSMIVPKTGPGVSAPDPSHGPQPASPQPPGSRDRGNRWLSRRCRRTGASSSTRRDGGSGWPGSTGTASTRTSAWPPAWTGSSAASSPRRSRGTASTASGSRSACG